MFSAIRKHDARDRDACNSAYRRGQEACHRSAGATIVNPFLPGTSFHKAFDLGVVEARASVWPGANLRQESASTRPARSS
jgi:hypothetical protein